jgi:hypothetical protein
MGSGEPVVRLTGVTKCFGEEIVAVDRVDLDVLNGCDVPLDVREEVRAAVAAAARVHVS